MSDRKRRIVLSDESESDSSANQIVRVQLPNDSKPLVSNTVNNKDTNSKIHNSLPIDGTKYSLPMNNNSSTLLKQQSIEDVITIDTDSDSVANAYTSSSRNRINSSKSSNKNKNKNKNKSNNYFEDEEEFADDTNKAKLMSVLTPSNSKSSRKSTDFSASRNSDTVAGTISRRKNEGVASSRRPQRASALLAQKRIHDLTETYNDEEHLDTNNNDKVDGSKRKRRNNSINHRDNRDHKDKSSDSDSVVGNIETKSKLAQSDDGESIYHHEDTIASRKSERSRFVARRARERRLSTLKEINRRYKKGIRDALLSGSDYAESDAESSGSELQIVERSTNHSDRKKNGNSSNGNTWRKQSYLDDWNKDTKDPKSNAAIRGNSNSIAAFPDREVLQDDYYSSDNNFIVNSDEEREELAKLAAEREERRKYKSNNSKAIIDKANRKTRNTKKAVNDSDEDSVNIVTNSDKKRKRIIADSDEDTIEAEYDTDNFIVEDDEEENSDSSSENSGKDSDSEEVDEQTLYLRFNARRDAEEQEREPENIMPIRKTFSVSEAMKWYILLLANALIDPEFLDQCTKFPYDGNHSNYLSAARQLENLISTNRESLLASSAWKNDFIHEIYSRPFYAIGRHAAGYMEAGARCEACGKTSQHPDFQIVLYGAEYDSPKVWNNYKWDTIVPKDLMMYSQECTKSNVKASSSNNSSGEAVNSSSSKKGKRVVIELSDSDDDQDSSNGEQKEVQSESDEDQSDKSHAWWLLKAIPKKLTKGEETKWNLAQERLVENRRTFCDSSSGTASINKTSVFNQNDILNLAEDWKFIKQETQRFENLLRQASSKWGSTREEKQVISDIWDDASDGTLNVGRSTPDRNRRSKMNKSVGSVSDSSVKRFNSLTVVSKFSPKSRQGSVMNWLNKNS